jgi:hypothetical protein
VPERHLAEDGKAALSLQETSLHESRTPGIATVWLLFYALAALTVVIAN